MAMPFLNHTETPLNFQKFKKNPKNSNLKSFWAFLLSILIYISVFYFFNLSLSTLLCTTKFWFIISNTLILIIATDFDAFSSKYRECYEDYGKLNNSLRIVIIPKPRREEDDEEPREKIIEIAADDHSKNQETVENNKAEIVKNNKGDDQTGNPNEKFEENEGENIISSLNSEIKNRAHEVKKRKIKRVRSNSEKAILMAATPLAEEKTVLRRTMSERQEEQRLEENEFSRMSDEELNRRVEEFIRRFNREMRLQAAAKNQENFEI